MDRKWKGGEHEGQTEVRLRAAQQLRIIIYTRYLSGKQAALSKSPQEIVESTSAMKTYVNNVKQVLGIELCVDVSEDKRPVTYY